MTPLAPLPTTSVPMLYLGGSTIDDVYSSIIHTAEIEGTPRLLTQVEAFGWSLTAGPCALKYALKQIETSIESEPAEDRPTHFALEAARQLLEDAQRFTANAVAPSSIEGFEGDLILHWEVGDRGFALVFPAWADKPVRLYREVLADGVPVETSLRDDPSDMDVAEMMAWLQDLA